MIRKPIVGVVGGGKVDAATFELARQVGTLVAAAGALLLCGGRGGVMEAAACGAREGGGRTIGILPYPPASGKKPNGFIECAVFTGLGDGRNYVNARTSDVLIALQGGPGTLSEISLALRLGVPVVFLDAWGFLAGEPALLGTPTVQASSPQAAVAGALRLIGFAPGNVFDAPFTYPLLPDQSAQHDQLLRFIAAADPRLVGH